MSAVLNVWGFILGLAILLACAMYPLQGLLTFGIMIGLSGICAYNLCIIRKHWKEDK